jgi:RHS repeat-associated protein
VVGFGWDANGNLASLTPPGKPAHTFRYTPVDQEREYEPPAVGASPPWITESTWDGDRRLDLVERPDATAIDLGYETPSGRLDAVTIPEGTIDLGYHPATGQLETLTAPGGGSLALGWNGFLLESQTWSGAVAGSVGFGYESPGMRLTDETVNGADMVSFQYDDDGLLDWAGDLDLTPHPSHGLLQDTTLGVVTTAYGYNAFGELASDTASVSGSPLYANQYTVRDKLGRIRQKVETIQGATTTWDYAYDPAGRLDTVDRTPSGGSAVRVADHAYDANGNRLCTNETAGACPAQAVYDEQDRLVSDEAGGSYAYTEAGELRRVSEGGTHTLYRTDALGALREVCLASSDPDICTGGTEIEYVIDALGRRIGKKVNTTLQKGYLWSDALRVVAELDGTGAVVSRFVYGTRPNVPEYMVKGGNTYRILTDHLGSVRLVVNAATGAVAQRIDYDVWGNPTFTGPADFQPFGFAGGLHDPDTGLVRLGARDYDAGTGRWTSKDPIRFDGLSLNLYSYSLSDSVNLGDPSGLIVPQLVGAGLGGITGAILSYGPNASWSQIATGGAIGAAAGFASTLPIPGVNPLLSGALLGGLANLGGNLGSQLVAGTSCDGIDWESAAVAGLAGIAGGGAGGAVQAASGSPALAAYVGGLATTYFDATARYSPQSPFPFRKPK